RAVLAVGPVQGVAGAQADLQKKSIHAAEQDRPDVAEARAAWRVARMGLDPRRPVFIDETWAKTNMTRLRGRAPRGQRVVEKAPPGHWKTSTLVAALAHRGIRCSMVLDGAVNADLFEAFVAKVLAPTLAVGDIAVMDNLSSHKTGLTRQMIEAVGAR